MKHSKQTILRGYFKNEGEVAPQKGARSQIIRDEDLKHEEVKQSGRAKEVEARNVIFDEKCSLGSG